MIKFLALVLALFICMFIGAASRLSETPEESIEINTFAPMQCEQQRPCSETSEIFLRNIKRPARKLVA